MTVNVLVIKEKPSEEIRSTELLTIASRHNPSLPKFLRGRNYDVLLLLGVDMDIIATFHPELALQITNCLRTNPDSQIIEVLD